MTGNTRPFIIVADPVHHLRTPEVFNDYLARSAFDGVLIPANVPAEGLAAFVDGVKQMRNLAGLIITVPHKVAIVPFCDELSPTARRVGSVNTIRVVAGRLIGENFDGVGFVKGLLLQGYDVSGRSALLLGSGGAARAIAFALADAGVRRLIISNRNIEKARELAASVDSVQYIEVHAAANPDTDSVDLIVNATSLGLLPDDPLPLDQRQIHANHMVAEVVMSPEVTKLLLVAKDRGASIHLGRHMLDAQIVEIGNYLTAV
ncbi:shikimate dehydrogenase [Ensifer sp. NM-2]|nr:shikimate dehydrogenase [Ensifer sp. NM-2]